MKRILIIIIVVVVAGLVWWLLSPLFLSKNVDESFPEVQNQEQGNVVETTQEEVVNEDMPDSSEPTLLASGNFVGADNFHQGSGTASVYTLADSSSVVRLEDFTVTNGPDLYVVLAQGENPTDSNSLGEHVILKRLKGNSGNQNYEIPSDVDSTEYKSVVIYCKAFSVVFATASLQ